MWRPMEPSASGNPAIHCSLERADSAGHGMGELARGHRNGRERAAQIMGGGRGQSAESRQLLLAGERHLRGRKRVRQPPRLVRDAPGVPGDHARATWHATVR